MVIFGPINIFRDTLKLRFRLEINRGRARIIKKEFLLKLVKDRQRWLYWLFQAKKRYGWIHSGYNEIQRPRQRYGIIDFNNLHISLNAHFTPKMIALSPIIDPIFSSFL